MADSLFFGLIKKSELQKRGGKMNKNSTFILLLSFISLLVCGCDNNPSSSNSVSLFSESTSSESSVVDLEPTVVSYDNTRNFAYLENRYNSISSCEINYGEYEEINGNALTTFLILDQLSQNVLFEQSYDVKTELPYRNLKKRKYIFVPTLNLSAYMSLVTPYVSFVSYSFSDKFDKCLSNANFEIIEKGSRLELARIISLDREYIIYNDGSIGLQYTDGYHISNGQIDVFDVYMEFLNAQVFSTSLEELVLELYSNRGVTDDGFSVSYGGKEIKLESFEEYLTYPVNNDAVFETMLINTKEFDFSKMLTIKYTRISSSQETVRYLSPAGFLLAKQDSLLSFGYYYYYLTTKTGSIYRCYHINMNMTKLLQLFE